MKLFTEEQVKHAIKMARSSYNLFTTPFIYEHDEVLENLTPIQLPSDEEIEEESPYVPSDASLDFWAHKEGFIDGVKWMRDKIQGGNNEQQ